MQSHHILPNAATMAGLCPTQIGLVKLTEANGIARRADEILGFITAVIVVSALCSYFSIRNSLGRARGEMLERIADVAFIVGLIGLAVASLLFAHEWI
ncbi:hypothetical protein [Methylobacterium nodulans]|uniref:Uncharacterized protein n=1 Tax=Methylobacterium nodulans (strain LMG 21967 / CNCM I-2342 / ORS 2060) TaxID=460265 RepID=B8IG86_METNO|nr:hypothetical protein [Methylobacterium nodulans]ACL61563.1 conserved hypothetical protein [Methylobacterium nodulans ORS 2060]